MNNLNDMYYFQLIIQKIFAFLRDLVIQEFSKLVSSNLSDQVVDEVKHLKNEETSLYKHNYVDFAVCFILCSFVGVLIFLSVKGNKEDEDDDFTDKTSTERIIMDLPEDPIYNFPLNWRPKISNYNRDRGDECFSEEDETPRKESHFKKKYRSRQNSRTSSIYGDCPSSCQYSQKSDILKSGANQKLWLIRKTRSGHVYGKYPF